MGERRKKAAHFLLISELAGSPPNEALVNGLLEIGYDVDLYAPGCNSSTEVYDSRVTCYPVEYNKRWILKNLLSNRWRKYHLFSGTSEDPIAVVGVLSWFYRKPAITLADEIRIGSYRGNAAESWKKLCRWGMLRSRLTIVNDESRIALQREYSGLSENHSIVVYPGCFRETPESGDRISLRQERGISPDALVLSYSGTFGHLLGAGWMIAAMEACSYLHTWAQIVNLDPLTRMLLSKTKVSDRLHIEPKRLSWKTSWSSMAAADIGMVVYHHSGPQFQNMGTSSNRLCMFLTMGVPVIASRQPSFEFIEKYECGILVETEQQFIDAIGVIRDNHVRMKENALRCAREYINASGKYQELLLRLAKL